MATRTVYGHTHGENGWPMVDRDSCQWITVPGTSVSLEIQTGQPLQILRAFAADFNAHVEPLRDADSACWTPTNSVATSNHLSGTACDLNWNGKDGRTFRLGNPEHVNFPPPSNERVKELLDFYEGMIFWGQRWSIQDGMHFQMGGNTYQNPKTADFIARKIRADGFSTFKRGGSTTPAQTPSPVSKADGYALAIIAEGRRRGITPRGIQIALATVIVESGFKMYANSSVPASLKLPHDAVGSDHDSLGLFQQRSPMWGPPEVLMDPTKSAGLFYDRLVKLNYTNPANPPGWYAAEVQRPAAQYRDRYQQRMGEAVALYNRLAGTPAGEDGFMSALSPQEQRALYDEIMARRQSRSPLRHVGSEWAGDMGDVAWNTDGSVHVLLNYLLAVVLGDPDAIRLLREVAAVNLVRYPERTHDQRLAQAMLNLIDKQATVASAPPTGQTPGVIPVTPAPPPIAPQITAAAPPAVEVVQQALPLAAETPAPTAEGGLLGEITALTAKLQTVSRQVTEITEGTKS